MTTPRRIAAAVSAAFALTLLMPVSGAHAALPSKNTTYKAVLDSDSYSGTVKIKVGSNVRKIVKVTIKVTCADGKDKIVFKGVDVMDSGSFIDSKGGKDPEYSLLGSFETKKRADGQSFLDAGPCQGLFIEFEARK